MEWSCINLWGSVFPYIYLLGDPQFSQGGRMKLFYVFKLELVMIICSSGFVSGIRIYIFHSEHACSEV